MGGGVQLFARGGGGGVQKLISVETYRNCDFPGRPIPSLYPRMFCLHLQLGPSNRSTFVGCVQALRDGTKFSLIYTCKGGGGSGSVVECLTPDRELASSSLTGVTEMCP